MTNNYCSGHRAWLSPQGQGDRRASGAELAVVEKADGSGKERKWIGTGPPEEDMAQYTELGLTPCVTNVIAGDLVLCKATPVLPAYALISLGQNQYIDRVANCHARAVDTALYHAGCPAEDPSAEVTELRISVADCVDVIPADASNKKSRGTHALFSCLMCLHGPDQYLGPFLSLVWRPHAY